MKSMFWRKELAMNTWNESFSKYVFLELTCERINDVKAKSRGSPWDYGARRKLRAQQPGRQGKMDISELGVPRFQMLKI